MEISQKNSFFS